MLRVSVPTGHGDSGRESAGRAGSSPSHGSRGPLPGDGSFESSRVGASEMASKEPLPPRGRSDMDGAARDGANANDPAADEPPNNLPSRHHAPSPHPTRSGTVRCLGCDVPFESWDRTRNRLCPRCNSRA